jgi:uncharacterized protein (DUF58 family)
VGEALRHLTARGRWLFGLGIVGLMLSLMLSQRDLMRIGIFLLALPVLSLLMVSRTRYRLSSARGLRPHQIEVDSTATCVVRVQNVSKLPSGLLMIEDTVPWQLGHNQRFILDRLGTGNRRDVRYEVSASLRGRYDIGPLRVQLVDPFGLCQMTRRFTTTDSLTVVPHVIALPSVPLVGDWTGMGESRSRAVANSGEDDVVPREYRTGDELRRVHWKSTARSGELMVRREEQPWRTRATVLLDTRAAGHRGEGVSSSFEWAVTAAASISCHLARRGFALRLLDFDATPLSGDSRIAVDGIAALDAERPVLDALAVVSTSKDEVPRLVDATVRERARDGLVVAVIGSLDPGYVEKVAAVRNGRGTALALIVDAAAWPGPRRTAEDGARLDAGAALLRAAGWRVVVCGPGEDLPAAWRALARGHGPARTTSFTSQVTP